MPNPRKPQAVKDRLGNPGKRGLMATASTDVDLAEPAPVVHVPPPPPGLRDAGCDAWAYVWRTATWLRPELDAPLVRQFCDHADVIAECRSCLGPYGADWTIYTAQSQRAHPLWDVLRQSEAAQLKIAAALGLSFRERQQLGVAMAKVVDPLTAFRADKAAADLAAQQRRNLERLHGAGGA